VLVRDSTVTNRFNAPHFAARPALACVNFDCFSHHFTMRFRVLRGINRCVCFCCLLHPVEAPSRLRLSSCGSSHTRHLYVALVARLLAFCVSDMLNASVDVVNLIVPT